ncbi:MAG: diguanylate cyclase [Nitrospiraceae bacterium]|nr:MAG: diguanylate cyclase [Nitrospiraceae bacterium]
MIKTNFLKTVMIISLLAILVMPLYFFLYLQPAVTGILTNFTEQEAIRITEHLTASHLQGITHLHKGNLPGSFVDETEEIQRDLELEKIKLFSSGGEIIYSSDASDIGKINKMEYFHTIVARGKTYAKIIKKNEKTLEDRIVQSDVVETYVPIMNAGRFIGALEIYDDVTWKHASIRALLLRSTATIFTLSFILLCALIFSIYHGERSLRRIIVIEEDLMKYKTHLEQLVNERTDELRVLNEQLEDDIALRKKAEASLQKSEERYRSLIESSDDSVYLIDRDCNYLYMNQKHLERMGLSNNEYEGKNYRELHSREEADTFAEHIKKVFATGDSLKLEYQSLRDNSYFLKTISPVVGNDGRIIAATIMSKDITAQKEIAEKLRALSITDELTGIYNRRGFYTLVTQQIKVANRMNRRALLLEADLDDLKTINDTYGHKVGDAALKEIAGLLKDTFRETDIIARIGGDEFIVFQLENEGTGPAKLIARMQEKLLARNADKSVKYQLSLSMGAVYYDPDAPRSVDELLVSADRLMYDQKRAKHHS